jgi:hypothetical protein
MEAILSRHSADFSPFENYREEGFLRRRSCFVVD